MPQEEIKEKDNEDAQDEIREWEEIVRHGRK